MAGGGGSRGLPHRARCAETQGGCGPGEPVLIHAVGSGVGTAAASLPTRWVARSSAPRERPASSSGPRSLGSTSPIDTAEEDFAAVVRQQTGSTGVDVVLDLIGAGALAGNLKALATRGRLVLVGLLGGGRRP